MKTLKIFLAIILAVICSNAYSQDTVDYYQLGGEYAVKGEYEKAIECFEKEIAREPLNYYAWFNRGLSKSFLGRQEEALVDYGMALELKPDYLKAYLNRALTMRDMGHLDAALEDLNIAVEIDSLYTDGLYHRGHIHEYLGNYKQACADLTLCEELGNEKLEARIKIACSESREDNYANILSLNGVSEDKTYGFSADNPIMVGTGFRGGPRNQRNYLDLLIDESGNHVTYDREGSCCDYPSENGMFGNAKLDRYLVTYRNAKGKKKNVTLYLSFYDYEDVKAVVGFTTR